MSWRTDQIKHEAKRTALVVDDPPARAGVDVLVETLAILL